MVNAVLVVYSWVVGNSGIDLFEALSVFRAYFF